MGTHILQLGSQISQFLGVGGVVAHHVLHQSHQLFHGAVLAGSAAAAAAAFAAVVMVVMVVIMVMVMLVVMIMMVVMMVVIVMMVIMVMVMIVVVVMHSGYLLQFFLYYNCENRGCQSIYFCKNIPPVGLRNRGK